MEVDDDGSHARCALREMSEEVVLPEKWMAASMTSMVLQPNGDALLQLVHAKWEAPQMVAMWVVKLDWEVAQDGPPVATAQGLQEMLGGSLMWRTVKDVVASLRQYVFMGPVADVLDRM